MTKRSKKAGAATGHRQKRRKAVTRQQLLDAAREVFAEKGLDGTVIDDITERADVGKGTFYYHFKGKGHLVKELIKAVLGQLSDLVRQRCANQTEIAEILDSFIQAHIDFFNQRWHDFVLFFQGRADLFLEESFPGIDTPFLEYLKTIEMVFDRDHRYNLSAATLRRVACAAAGFVSGYYSFALIATEGEEIQAAFRPLRGAMVASLERLVKNASSGVPDGSA